MNWRRAEALYVTTNWSNADLRQRGCAASGWYSLAGHGVQLAAFFMSEYVCTRHRSQARSAVALGTRKTYSPAAHTVLRTHVDWPLRDWYSPVGQSTQSVLPTPGWCLPGSHAEHCSAALVVFRALSPRLPALQLTQRACPSLDWCLPAGHDWQCRDDVGSIAASPKRPGLHG